MILQGKKGSFVPSVSVYTVHNNGWSETAELSGLEKMVADEKNERCADVIGHIKTRLRFLLLNSSLRKRKRKSIIERRQLLIDQTNHLFYIICSSSYRYIRGVLNIMKSG